MRLFWQLFPASGIRAFDTVSAAAAWADAFLADNPTATVESLPASSMILHAGATAPSVPGRFTS